MKRFCVLSFLLVFFISYQQAQITLENLIDSMSYAIGFDIGSNIKKGEVELDIALIAEGLAKALESDDPELLSAQDIQVMIQAWQMQAQQKYTEQIQKIAEENRAEGDAFLAENAEIEGITVTESGLQYKVIEEGEGDRPTDSSMVTVHYEGKLLDGTTFDSSYERGEPIEFEVGQVIPGWTEAIQLMRPGAKWQVFIPSDLGYGERGTPNGEIPPNSVLIFDVELLSVQ